MLESHAYFEDSKPAHTTHGEREKRKGSKLNLIKYAFIAPATALAIVGNACREGEQKIEDSISPTSVARHIETATPTLETPGKIISAGVNVELSEGVKENVSTTGRTIAQDIQTIHEVAQKFPLPDRFTVVLTSDYHNDRAEGSLGKVYVGINRVRAETIQYSGAHELVHILDPKTNEEFLLKYYTPHQIAELKKLRDEVLSDPIWGRDYPSAERIIAGKRGANVIPREGDTLSQLAAGADIDANGIWIEGYNPFESDLEASHQIMASQPQSDNEYGSIEEFVQQNKDLIDKYFSASPLTKYAQEDFHRLVSSGMLTPENAAWTAMTDNQAYLNGRYHGEWSAVTERLTKIIIFEKYETGQLEEFINTLPESKQEFLKKAFEFKRDHTDSEKFANIIATTVHTNSPGPGRDFIERLAMYNTVNKTVSAEQKSPGDMRLENFDLVNNLVVTD